MNVNTFSKLKKQQKKITVLTCYDYCFAQILARTEVDALLVGDSVAMVVHGYLNTTMATVDMMVTHTEAVARGAPKKFIIADLPFLSYRKSMDNTLGAVERLIQAGAHAVKLEGAKGNIATIRHVVESGVPVMGHIGLTPQAIHVLGSYSVQGKEPVAERQLIDDALALEQSGCFALVLECIPATLAQLISQQLTIPTIGIGAGMDTGGQVLVLHDLLGLQTELKPKFLKTYLSGEKLTLDAVNAYLKEVSAVEFPSAEHCY